MERARWLSVERIAAAVAANRSPQRVCLYGSSTVEVLAGPHDSARAPRHRRARSDATQHAERDHEGVVGEQAPLESDAAPV
jgi:hypothetical protein